MNIALVNLRLTGISQPHRGPRSYLNKDFFSPLSSRVTSSSFSSFSLLKSSFEQVSASKSVFYIASLSPSPYSMTGRDMKFVQNVFKNLLGSAIVYEALSLPLSGALSLRRFASREFTSHTGFSSRAAASVTLSSSTLNGECDTGIPIFPSGSILTSRSVFTGLTDQVSVCGCVFRGVNCGHNHGALYISGVKTSTHIHLQDSIFVDCVGSFESAGAYITSALSMTSRFNCFDNLNADHTSGSINGANALYTSALDDFEITYTTVYKCPSNTQGTPHNGIFISWSTGSLSFINMSNAVGVNVRTYCNGLHIYENIMKKMSHIHFKDNTGAHIVIIGSSTMNEHIFEDCLFINNHAGALGLQKISEINTLYSKCAFIKNSQYIFELLPGPVNLVDCSFSQPEGQAFILSPGLYHGTRLNFSHVEHQHPEGVRFFNTYCYIYYEATCLFTLSMHAASPVPILMSIFTHFLLLM